MVQRFSQSLVGMRSQVHTSSGVFFLLSIMLLIFAVVKCDKLFNELSPFSNTRIASSSANLLDSVSDISLRQSWMNYKLASSSFIVHSLDQLYEALDLFYVEKLRHLFSLHPYYKHLYRLRNSTLNKDLENIGDIFFRMNKLVQVYSVLVEDNSRLPESSPFALLAWNFKMTLHVENLRVLFLRKKTKELFTEFINHALHELLNFLSNLSSTLPINSQFIQKVHQATLNSLASLNNLPFLQRILYQSAGYSGFEDIKVLLRLYLDVNPVNLPIFNEASFDDYQFMIYPQFKDILKISSYFISGAIHSSNILRKVSTQIDISLSKHLSLRKDITSHEGSSIMNMAVIVANDFSALIASPYTVEKGHKDFRKVSKIYRILREDVNFFSRELSISEILEIVESLKVCKDLEQIRRILLR
jgi:hypothetical protein